MALFDKLTVVLWINEKQRQPKKKKEKTSHPFEVASISFIASTSFAVISRFWWICIRAAYLQQRRTASCTVHLPCWCDPFVINNLCYTIFYVYLNSCSFRIWFEAIIIYVSTDAIHTNTPCYSTMAVCSACIHLRNSFDVKRHSKIMAMCTCQRQVFPCRVK